MRFHLLLLLPQLHLIQLLIRFSLLLALKLQLMLIVLLHFIYELNLLYNYNSLKILFSYFYSISRIVKTFKLKKFTAQIK